MSRNSIISYDDLPVSVKNENSADHINIKTGISLDEVEKIVIQSTLSSLNGNKSKTADVLGIGRKTLHRKLNEYNL